MGVKMLILALFLACAEHGDTDYECEKTEQYDAMSKGMFQDTVCVNLGLDAAAGDTDAQYILDMDPKDIGEKYNCKPPEIAGEDCLRIADEHLTGTE